MKNTSARHQRLLYAAMHGDFSGVQQNRMTIDEINQVDYGGSQCLVAASSRGDLKIVKFLVSIGADMNLQDKRCYYSLMQACNNNARLNYIPVHPFCEDEAFRNMTGRFEIKEDKPNDSYLQVLEFIMRMGADVDLNTQFGEKALALASSQGRLTEVRYLLSKGLSINTRNNDWGASPLHLACSGGHQTIVQYLLAHGADVNAIDNQSRTPLILATSGCHVPTVESLIAHGATVDAKNTYGLTALMIASGLGYRGVVIALLTGGADITLLSKDGKSAFEYAVEPGVKQILKTVQERKRKSQITVAGKRLNELSATDVTNLLANAFPSIPDVIRFHGLTGASLADFKTKEEIRECGFNLIDAMKIIQSIKEWKHHGVPLELLEARPHPNPPMTTMTMQAMQPSPPVPLPVPPGLFLPPQPPKNDAKIPDSFVCPISCEMMRDPVVCADGHSYERSAIEMWLRDNNTSPLTNNLLSSKTVTPNHTLKKSIEEYLGQR